jgi:HTH-type transcriptional regulator / antitoxin HigA
MASGRDNEFVSGHVFPPGDTLLETIDAMGLSQKALALRMGVTEKHINEVIKGKASISEEIALRLERVLGVSASFWRTLEHTYRTFLARQDENERLKRTKAWLKKFPLKSMIERGWITQQDNPIDLQRELLKYFGVANWGSWEDVWTRNATYRRSSAFESNPKAIAAWIRQGELVAKDMACATFDNKRFKDALQLVRRLTREAPEGICPKLQEICSSCGVAVMFLPELPGMRVSGATWWHRNKAVIQLSDRYKSDDQFWFSFFHEAGHVLLHGKKEVFIDDHQSREQDRKEQEANRFAADFLIPPPMWDKLLASGRPTLGQIQSFADLLDIAPEIVVGRLQHEGILSFKTGNRLKKRLHWKQPDRSAPAVL